MKMGSRFTWKFIVYFALFYMLINIAVFALLMYFGSRLEGEVMTSDLTVETTANMQSLVHLDGRKTTISDDLMKALKKNDGTLLIRNIDGKVIKVFNAGDDQVRHISWYYFQDLTTWSLTPEYQAVYINRKPIVRAAELFDMNRKKELYRYIDKHDIGFFRQTEKIIDGTGNLDKKQYGLKKIRGAFNTADVKKEWYQDKNGDNFNKYNIRETIRGSEYYLFVSRNASQRDKGIIFEDDGFLKDDDFMRGVKLFFIWYIIFSLIILLFILALALLVGQRMTRPLVHFIKWVEQLRGGNYTVPDNHQLYRKDRLRRKYRMYHSVDNSIRELTMKLKSDEDYQQRISTLREEWIAGISHDIKTPLSSIYGYSKLLNSEIEINCEDRKKFAEIIEDKAMYIDALLKDLNMTYQLKNDVLEFNKQEVDIVDYINEFITHFDQTELHYLNQTSGRVSIDTERMTRALTNIVTNAFVHNDDIDVWINTTVIETEVVIEVTDNGQGIDPKELPYIFDRYYRGTSTSSEHEGSGLGLAVAQQIVHSHGGRIVVKSSVAGTKFLIYLPKIND